MAATAVTPTAINPLITAGVRAAHTGRGPTVYAPPARACFATHEPGVPAARAARPAPARRVAMAAPQATQRYKLM